MLSNTVDMLKSLLPKPKAKNTPSGTPEGV
jgi:hypothetical protein